MTETIRERSKGDVGEAAGEAADGPLDGSPLDASLSDGSLSDGSLSGGASAEATARAFAALGSPMRLTILRILVRAGRTGTSVGAVQDRIGLGASTLSHHLRALVQAGVIEQERDGRRLICRARPERIRALSDFLLDECCLDEGGRPSDCGV